MKSLLPYLLVLFASIGIKIFFQKRYNFELKPNVDTHNWIYEDNFFTKETLIKLDKIIQANKMEIILEDTGVENAGEMVEAGHVDCAHPYMSLNSNGTYCLIPKRIDIAMHFMKTGGFEGIMETFDKMAARLFSFRHKLLNSINETSLRQMYGNKFLNKASEICKQNSIKLFQSEQPLVDLFQFDVIIILPGQELPIHLDIPYFWNADRRSLPHWLLALMKQSKLFDKIFIPQVQGVAWLSKHQLNKNEEESKQVGGNFYFYPYKQNEYEDEYLMVKSKHNSAILLDGTQVLHAVERFKSYENTPSFNKNERYYIKFNDKNDTWNLFDSKDNFINNYLHKDVRVSLVWRVHCFDSEEEKKKYKSQKFEEQLKLNDIFEIFKRDLIKKKKCPSPK